MKISIEQSDERKINLIIPNFLITNRFVCIMIKSILNKKNVNIKTKDLIKIMKVIKKLKKRFGDWKLFEVESRDKAKVIIKI